MTYEALCEAMEEAERFLKLAKIAKARAGVINPSDPMILPHRVLDNAGDVNDIDIASRSLTRALARMRRY